MRLSKSLSLKITFGTPPDRHGRGLDLPIRIILIRDINCIRNIGFNIRILRDIFVSVENRD